MLAYVDAGHTLAFVRRHNGGVEGLGQRALPVGFVDEPCYRADRVQLAPGDTLVVYSDGLEDPRTRIPLTTEDVAARLDGGKNVTEPSELLLEEALARGPLSDDLTLLLVQRLE